MDEYFRLMYDIHRGEHPLDLILTPKHLASCNQVFFMFVKVKRISGLLNRAWKMLMERKGGINRKWRLIAISR